MTRQEMIQAHPLPWRYVAQGALITMVDGLGQTVQLFEMLDFVVAVTAEMAAARPAAAA